MTNSFVAIIKIIASLWKAFYEKRGPTVSKNFLWQLYVLVSEKKKTCLSIAEQANTEISLAIKAPLRFLTSSF